MKNFISLLTGVVLVTVLSCQRTPNLEPVVVQGTGTAADIQVVDGRLNFVSKKDFDQTVQFLVQQQDKLDEFERKYAGFVSVRTAFSQMTEKDNETVARRGVGEHYKGYVIIKDEGEEKEIARTITSPILATLVSKDGWLYIGNDAYYFGGGKFQVVQNRTNTKLANVTAGKLGVAGVINGTVSHTLKTSARAKPHSTVNCIDEYFIGSNKFRMAGDIDYSHYSYPTGVLYVDVSIYTKHQRRNFGTYWTNSPCVNLSMTGTLLEVYSNASYPRSFSKSEPSVSLIYQVYPTSSGNYPGYSNISTQHNGTGDNNNNQLSCTINI